MPRGYRAGRLLVQGRLKVRTGEKRERLRESGSINRVERIARVEGLMNDNRKVCGWLVRGGIAAAETSSMGSGSFASGGKTCEHVNARGASRRKRVLACLQVVCRLCQLSKNDSSPLSEKKPFYIIPDPMDA